MGKRLDMEAATVESAADYLHTRARQIQHLGWTATDLVAETEGVRLYADHPVHGPHQSYYLLNAYRGNGRALPGMLAVDLPIVTLPDCHIEGFLRAKGVKYHMARSDVWGAHEYWAIGDMYGDRVAKRTNQFLMNHIDEGLMVLSDLGASRETMLAYCLHPLVQEDNSLKVVDLRSITQDPYVLALAMEYRSVAQEYLSPRTIGSLEEIRLSPLPEVNDMLRADKVQNRKDFEIYHLGTHARSEALAEYFQNWLARLEVSEAQYQTWAARMSVPVLRS